MLSQADDSVKGVGLLLVGTPGVGRRALHRQIIVPLLRQHGVEGYKDYHSVASRPQIEPVLDLMARNPRTVLGVNQHLFPELQRRIARSGLRGQTVEIRLGRPDARELVTLIKNDVLLREGEWRKDLETTALKVLQPLLGEAFCGPAFRATGMLMRKQPSTWLEAGRESIKEWRGELDATLGTEDWQALVRLCASDSVNGEWRYERRPDDAELDEMPDEMRQRLVESGSLVRTAAGWRLGHQDLGESLSQDGFASGAERRIRWRGDVEARRGLVRHAQTLWYGWRYPTWVAPTRRYALWKPWLGLVMTTLIGLAAWFAFQETRSRRAYEQIDVSRNHEQSGRLDLARNAAHVGWRAQRNGATAQQLTRVLARQLSLESESALPTVADGVELLVLDRRDNGTACLLLTTEPPAWRVATSTHLKATLPLLEGELRNAVGASLLSGPRFRVAGFGKSIRLGAGSEASGDTTFQEIEVDGQTVAAWVDQSFNSDVIWSVHKEKSEDKNKDEWRWELRARQVLQEGTKDTPFLPPNRRAEHGGARGQRTTVSPPGS